MISVFKKAIYDTRKTTMWLSIGLALYVLMVMSFYPAIVEQADKFDEIIKSYPPEMLALMGGGIDVDQFSITDPGSYLKVEFSTWALLIIGAIVILQAFNAFTNAERDNSMEMMLSLPVSRRDLLLGRLAATAVMILVVETACFLAFVLSTSLWPEFDIAASDLAVGIYGGFFPLMVIATFSYMLATVVPSSWRFAGAVAYLFMIVSYLIYGLTGVSDKMNDIKPLFFYHYYDVAALIKEGINLQDWAILSAAALLYFAVSWWAVDRKELGV
jgi:ABC-2 type transport system permease protein